MTNNNIHGVELIFQEERERKKKDSKEKELYIFKDVWYYPNPIKALEKWIELTNNSTDLTELVKHYQDCNKTIARVYEDFKNNKFKL